ncbi:hypothetical protein ACFFKU_15020 [Kineococcus gynurae]|uniref:Integral membrane protein n=1 Tax=Kineococcus gynurae TaxID=452979 RepID=A0ABV5LTH9_9ACTN
MALPLALLPYLLPFLLAAAVVGGVLVVRHVPDGRLTQPVARARRRGWLISLGAASAAALTATLVAVAAARGGGLGAGQLLAVTPLVAAGAHAAVVLTGELTWPRPRDRVRSARLVARSIADSSPRWLLRTGAVATLLLAGVCGLGMLLADDDGRTISYAWGTPELGGGGSHSPFPGTFYAGPVALALVVLVLLTGAVLHRVPQRPALLDADADAVLRRAAGVRVLRVATSAVLGTTGALLVVGAMAARGLAAVGGLNAAGGDPGPGPLWAPLGAVGLVTGLVTLAAALAVLLVPTTRVRA